MRVVAQFEIRYLQYLDADGKLADRELPEFARDAGLLTDLYQRMVYARVFDGKMLKLQRTGRIGTFSSALGHEAVYTGLASAMRDEDIFAPTYRETPALLYRGVRPREFMTLFGGDESGSDYANEPARHDFPVCIPIATQCLHAAGAALAFKMRGEPRVAVFTVGDGGTSKGDFMGALNIGGVLELPLVGVITDNQWAISVPRSHQTAAQTLAQKAIAAGLPSVQVDGNDIIAVRKAVGDAVERARSGGGASVVEAITYRLGDHTTADDASRYGDPAALEQAWKEEPIARLRKYLESIGAWSTQQEDDWQAQCDRELTAEVDAYLEHPDPPITDMFDHMYEQLPEDLQAQRARAVQWAQQEQ